MRPTEILIQEHRVIEQVLNCLEQLANECDSGKDLDTQSARQAVDFFQNFADRCHHGKEEDCLFPLMESVGFSREQGPTGVMLVEHEEGRRRVRGMLQAIEEAEAGKSEATSTFITHARAFIPLLREHINKENHCLFPMADRALSGEEQQQLIERFEKVEREDLDPGMHEKYLDIAKQLAERFGVEQCKPGDSQNPGCCSHD